MRRSSSMDRVACEQFEPFTESPLLVSETNELSIGKFDSLDPTASLDIVDDMPSLGLDRADERRIQIDYSDLEPITERAYSSNDVSTSHLIGQLERAVDKVQKSESFNHGSHGASSVKPCYSPKLFTRLDHPVLRVIEIFAKELAQGSLVFNSQAQIEWVNQKSRQLLQKFPELTQIELNRIIDSLSALVDLDQTERREQLGLYRIRIDKSFFTIYIKPNPEIDLSDLIRAHLDDPHFIKFCIKCSKQSDFDRYVFEYFFGNLGNGS